MNLKFLSLAAALSVSVAGVAHADIACLIEGKVMGETIKDCSQTSLPIPRAQYAEQCNDGPAGSPLKGTILNACPAKAQAACVGPYGQKVTAYYYARTPKFLAETKTSCVAQRGKWVVAP